MEQDTHNTTTTTIALPLQDRVAIVTGASRGIAGHTIVLHLATLGAKVVINYTSPSSNPHVKSLVSHINSTTAPPCAITVQADVSDEAQVKVLFTMAEHTFNTQPHIVVTFAGVMDHRRSPLAKLDTVEFDRIFMVNARGTFLCIKEAANKVVRGGGGRIVMVSSSVAASFRERLGAYADVVVVRKIMDKFE